MAANPTDLNVADGAALFRAHDADMVIAVGGGSGLDAGKSIAMVSRSMRPVGEFEWTLPPPDLKPGTIPPIVTVPASSPLFFFQFPRRDFPAR